MEKQMNEIMAENKRLTEPLQKAREEVEELRKQVRVKKKLQLKLKAQMTCFNKMLLGPWLVADKPSHLPQSFCLLIFVVVVVFLKGDSKTLLANKKQ